MRKYPAIPDFSDILFYRKTAKSPDSKKCACLETYNYFKIAPVLADVTSLAYLAR